MPRRHRTALAAVALAPALLLASCGGDDEEPVASAPTSGTTTDAPDPETTSAAPAGEDEVPDAFPCDDLLPAEVGAIAGGTYTFELGPFDACEYTPDDVRSKPSINVEIPEGEFDLSGITGGTEIPGLGIKGYVRRDTSFPNVTVATVQLNTQGTVVQVSVTGGDDATRDDVAADVLKVAFSKI